MAGIILVNTPPLGIEKVHPLRGHGDLKRENNQDYVSRKEVGQWPLGREPTGSSTQIHYVTGPSRQPCGVGTVIFLYR